MSCPDWRRLAAAGEEFLRPGDPSRRTALEHTEECPACRRQALRLDPSLAASGLASSSPPVDRSEIEAIKSNVLALRRVRRMERRSRPRRAGVRLTAVACLTVAILLFAEETANTPRGEAPTAAVPSPLLTEDYRLYGSLPLVESLEPAEARVYQLGRDDFSMVWIVDESIEVRPRP